MFEEKWEILEGDAVKVPVTVNTAENVTVTYGDTDKKVVASVTRPATGGGSISYAVKDGSADYIEVVTGI